jgi:OmpR family two-component system bacitracin resistance response regulator BceR
MFKIMVIEDDEHLYRALAERLTAWSYEPVPVADFRLVMDEFTAAKPDLVLIDIQLPLFDGFHWLRRIREVSQVPVIFLSSRNHPTDIVMAMQLGADDYIEKPFNFEVLVAKIQAVFRRVYDYDTMQRDQTVRAWRGYVVDLSRQTVSRQQGGLAAEGQALSGPAMERQAVDELSTQRTEQSVELTKNEAYILRMLLDKKNQVVSRAELIKEMWQEERYVSDNTLTVNVNRLRKKLEEIGLTGAIDTKVGQGYIALD